jgi:hypothetical protein
MFQEFHDDPIRAYQHEQQSLSTNAEQLRPILKACQDAVSRANSQAIPKIRTMGLQPVIYLILAASEMKEATNLMRELAKEGIRSHDKKFHDRNLFDAIGMREYELTKSVYLSVMLLGETCKMVQVGTKEVPVYDIQCGETLDAIPQAPRLSQPANT